MEQVLKLPKRNPIEKLLCLNRINGSKKVTERRKKGRSNAAFVFLTEYTVRRLDSFKRPRVTHKIARGCSFSPATIIQTSYQISCNSFKKEKNKKKNTA